MSDILDFKRPELCKNEEFYQKNIYYSANILRINDLIVTGY